ncbi:MAG: hypothetical protein U1F42_10495 [Candidatus Competibacteraceae bacterium]
MLDHCWATLRFCPTYGLKAARATLVAEPLAPMTPEEISAEIAAYRFEQRRSSASATPCSW